MEEADEAAWANQKAKECKALFRHYQQKALKNISWMPKACFEALFLLGSFWHTVEMPNFHNSFLAKKHFGHDTRIVFLG